MTNKPFKINPTTWALQTGDVEGVLVSVSGYCAQGCSCGARRCEHRAAVQAELSAASVGVALPLNGNQVFNILK